MLKDTRSRREETCSETPGRRSHLPMPGEEMHLHNGVLDAVHSRGSYGPPASPWPALLVALVLGLGPLGLLLCSAPAWGAASASASDASSEHYLAQGLQSFQRGAFEQAVV